VCSQDAVPLAAGGSGSASSGGALLSWEPLWRHACVKHSWRGRYARVLALSAAGVATLDPSPGAGLAPTNTWRWGGEFGGAACGEARGEVRCSMCAWSQLSE
jgi:DnaJ family protein C protein 13